MNFINRKKNTSNLSSEHWEETSNFWSKQKKNYLNSNQT